MKNTKELRRCLDKLAKANDAVMDAEVELAMALGYAYEPKAANHIPDKVTTAIVGAGMELGIRVGQPTYRLRFYSEFEKLKALAFVAGARRGRVSK